MGIFELIKKICLAIKVNVIELFLG